MKKPFKVEERSGFFVVVDSRNGRLCSYPSSKGPARAGAALMNRTYAEMVEEDRQLTEASKAGALEQSMAPVPVMPSRPEGYYHSPIGTFE